ncbi:Rab3 GTPase-activating protein catalytic subunit [Balamuthia mandrillaris]
MRNRNRKVYRQANNNKSNKTKPLEGFWESELLWGTTKDPIDAMHLAVTWESAPVVQVLSPRESLHNKNFLTPGASSVEGVVVKTEPKWSLRCIYKKNNVYFLSESLKSFLSAYIESKKWISMHNLLLSVPKGRPTNEMEGEARVLYAMESIGRSLAASLQSAAHFPTAQEIDSMLQYLFDPEKEFSEVTSTKQTNEERYFPSYSQPIVELQRSLKSAPPGSLLSSLSSCLLSLEGLNAIAVVWNEFVKECRWHWDNLKFIPRIERQRMNYSTCLLYQKLQLINYCIERKLALGEKSNAEIEQELKAAARYNEDLQQSEDNPQQEQNVITSRFAFTEDELVEEEEEEEEGDKGWDIGLEDDEAAETNGWDDAEIELPEDPSSQEETDTSNGNINEATNNSQQGRKGAKELFIISSAPSEEQEANEKKPEANKRNRTERLLASGEEMWVPFTQPHGWMTEDMLEEQEKIFEELGSSIEAQQIRAKMQSASLLSDMEAFKAANPGCMLEDFVRWYSPSDWIVESKEQMLADYARKKQERKQRKEDEATKMKEDKQEENENALEENEGQLEKEEEIKLPNYFEFEENGKTMVGYLSTRMQMANNLWLQTWQEAKAVPITSQKLLFDHNKEAEKAIHYLETLSPFSFMQQMVGVGLSCAYSSLCRLPCVVHIAPVKEALESLRQTLRSIDTAAITTTVQTQLLQIITQTEQLCAAATSLLHKLPNQNEVVGRLMANMMNTNMAAADEVVLSKGDALAQAKSLFLYHHTNAHSFGREERQQRAPQAKEYILRSMVPSPLSFSLPQRLYVLVTHSECRKRQIGMWKGPVEAALAATQLPPHPSFLIPMPLTTSLACPSSSTASSSSSAASASASKNK